MVEDTYDGCTVVTAELRRDEHAWEWFLQSTIAGMPERIRLDGGVSIDGAEVTWRDIPMRWVDDPSWPGGKRLVWCTPEEATEFTVQFTTLARRPVETDAEAGWP